MDDFPSILLIWAKNNKTLLFTDRMNESFDCAKLLNLYSIFVVRVE